MKFKIDEIIKGICFICKEKCKDEAYCHEHCALAKSIEQAKRIKEADKRENGTI